MIEKEYIIGVTRAGKNIPEWEIQQMVGRCGRSYTQSGTAVVVCSPGDAAYASECLYGKPRPVISNFSDVSRVAFHVIPAIRKKPGFSEDDYLAWSSRSLAAQQGVLPQWRDVLSSLEINEAISDGKLTKIGNLSFHYYYPPERVLTLKNRLMMASDLHDVYQAAWAFAYTPLYKSYEIQERLDDFVSLTPYRFYDGEEVDGLCYYCMLSRTSIKPLRHRINAARRDFSRLCSLALDIAGSFHIVCADAIPVWREAALRGLPYALARISVEFPGISRGLLEEMDVIGVRTIEDITTHKGAIDIYGSDELKRYINGLGNQSIRA